jgi:purine-binding chemotaxis protein CheW
MILTQTHLNEEPQELCVVQLGHLTCGVDLRCVLEIAMGIEISQAYGTADFVRGVANLRGDIVTVIDFRKRLDLEPSEDRPRNKVLIVGSRGEKIGLLVDEVCEIIPVESQYHHANVTNLKDISQDFYSGIYKDPEQLIVVVNLEGVLYKEAEVELI